MVFQEPDPVEDDEPIHLVIPNQDRFKDIPIRLADAVNLLAAVEDRSVETVLADIQHLASKESNLQQRSPKTANGLATTN